jgi:hypothetical protein
MSLALLLVVADKAANGGKWVVFKEKSASLVKFVFLQQSDDLGDRRADGTALHTLWIFTLQASVCLVNYV